MLDSDEALVAIVFFGSTAGFFGNATYIISLLYFSPVITSAGFLFEPLGSQLVAFALKIDKVPGWATWTGTACFFIGVLMI